MIRALLRKTPLQIPAAAYDCEAIRSSREPGAQFRQNSSATILFADGHTGPADWCRYGGEPQPEDQKLLVKLRAGDSLGYRLEPESHQTVEITLHYHGTGVLTIQSTAAENGKPCSVTLPEDRIYWVTCREGEVLLESVYGL